MNKLFSYNENIKREFGAGWEPRDLKNKEKELYKLETKKKAWSERVSRDQANYEKNPKNEYYQKMFTDAVNGLEKITKEYEGAKNALHYGDAFGTDMPSKPAALVSCEGELNLADIYDIRHDIGKITNTKNEHIVVENYNDTTTHFTDEGQPIPHKDITDYINVIPTDFDCIKKIAGILDVPEDMLSDEKPLLNGSIDSIQKKHLSNTETLLLCRAIQTSKVPINIDAGSVSLIVNTHLCAKARLSAEIITNDSGFSKLDLNDTAGNPLLKKNFTLGEYIFADKFIVRVLSDDILPNNEDGSSPIFVGDWRNVLRLVIVKKYPPLIKENLLSCIVENRAVTYTLPILTTKSDKAFIVGKMS